MRRGWLSKGVRIKGYNIGPRDRSLNEEPSMKTDINRVTRVPEYFPAETVEKTAKKLLVLLDGYGVDLGFEFGLDDPIQSTRDLLSQSIRETERLLKRLRESSERLDLLFPREPLTPLSPPDQSALSVLPLEIQP